MKKKMIVYFHGYGSSSKTDKVSRLAEEPNFNVYSFDINIDPDVAYKHLETQIDMALLDDLHVPEELVFVGTSLGAWWAAKMADVYKCKAIIINPSIDPKNSLEKYGVAENIREKYTTFIPANTHKYFFAEFDRVINSEQFREDLITSGHDVTITSGADHSFKGKPFEQVVTYLQG